MTHAAYRFAFVAGVAALAAAADARAGEPPQLSLPVACEPGRTCFVQNHVDLDPGPERRDFACGTATYDGHKGVDFRLLSAAAATAGVAVLAAAPGTVKGVRDGMADAMARETDGQAFAGRECGNGVVVDHGGGWETQYCHMRRGSVAVRSGETVERGAKLGQIGYSGFADFAHLHFAVRRDGAVIDPYSGAAMGAPCARGGAVQAGLWDAPARRALPYRTGELIEAGFAAAVPTTLQLEQGGDRLPAAGPDGDGLVFYARLMNPRAGDRIRITASGPAGFKVDATSPPIERDRAMEVRAAGRKRTLPRWPAGRYEGVAELVRDGAIAASARGSFDMP